MPYIALETRQVVKVGPDRDAWPRCGARTRAGGRCMAPPVRRLAPWSEDPAAVRVWGRWEPANGRCRMHGGLSTGARTEAGRERLRQLGRERYDAWYREQVPPDVFASWLEAKRRQRAAADELRRRAG